ncbi:MAG: hypothetical protein AAFX56_02005 [Pseudomonadota bacterium]
MRALPLLALFLACCALADESPDGDPGSVYESIDKIRIGRVFLSTAERDRLDVLRRQPNSAGSADEPAQKAASSVSRSSPASGYIKVPGKRPSVFSAGRFVPTESESITLPTKTEGLIVRHANAGDDGAGDEEQHPPREEAP